MAKIILKLHSLCNLKCGYCFEKEKIKYRFSTDSFNELDREVSIKNIVNNDLFDDIIITGGEPTLYPELDILIDKFSSKNITLLTNGVNSLKDKNYLKKINVVVSLDGNEYIMKKQRGISYSTFRTINKNIKNYINSSNHVEISSLITKYNLFENEYYPFAQFGENCTYNFIVPSIMFTTSEFKLLPIDYVRVSEMLLYFQSSNNFRLDASINIFPTKYVKENINQVIDSLFIVEYDLEKNIFCIFDDCFYDINTLLKSEHIIKRKLFNILEKQMKFYNNVYVNPYNEIELGIYNSLIKWS